LRFKRLRIYERATRFATMQGAAFTTPIGIMS